VSEEVNRTRYLIDNGTFMRYVALAIGLLFTQQLFFDEQSEVPAIAQQILRPYTSYYTRLIHEPRFETHRLLILMKYYSVLSVTAHEKIAQKFPKKMLNELLSGLRKERNNLMIYEDQIKRYYPKNQMPTSVRKTISYYAFTLERAIRDVARRLQFHGR